MIPAVPYIETTGTDKFKKFLLRLFTIDMLYPIFNAGSCETLFDGWRGKDMLGWYKFTNENNFVLEFYPKYYVIKKNGQTGYQMPLPTTIDSFINTMRMFGVDLYWTSWIDENFEPKDYMKKEDIEGYFTNLLTKLNKANEIN